MDEASSAGMKRNSLQMKTIGLTTCMAICATGACFTYLDGGQGSNVVLPWKWWKIWSGRDADDDFAEMRARLHAAQGGGEIFECVNLVDDGLDAVLLKCVVHLLELSPRANVDSLHMHLPVEDQGNL